MEDTPNHEAQKHKKQTPINKSSCVEFTKSISQDHEKKSHLLNPRVLKKWEMGTTLQRSVRQTLAKIEKNCKYQKSP